MNDENLKRDLTRLWERVMDHPDNDLDHQIKLEILRSNFNKSENDGDEDENGSRHGPTIMKKLKRSNLLLLIAYFREMEMDDDACFYLRVESERILNQYYPAETDMNLEHDPTGEILSNLSENLITSSVQSFKKQPLLFMLSVMLFDMIHEHQESGFRLAEYVKYLKRETSNFNRPLRSRSRPSLIYSR